MRNKLLGDRVRAAICVALHDARAPRRTAEIVAAIEAMGIPLGTYPAKTVGDAIRWEVQRGRVRRSGRGTYRLGTVPRTTLIYMRRRVEAYAAGETSYAVIADRRRLSETAAPGAAASLSPDEVTLVIDNVMASQPKLPLSPPTPRRMQTPRGVDV